MRIVALSDQHGLLPDIPPCDLLIIAGDNCPDQIDGVDARHDPARQADWFNRRFRPWLAAAPATHRVMTWGNHDWCGEDGDFTADAPGRAASTVLQILVQQQTTVTTPDGAPVTIWGAPWTTPVMDWAFTRDPDDVERLYGEIPKNVDILVTHQPPYGYGDRSPLRPGHEGNGELLAAIEAVRPGLVICGHIHGGHGHYSHLGVPIYNVSVLDDEYHPVNEPTIIEF